jgi:hypothetical protein
MPSTNPHTPAGCIHLQNELCSAINAALKTEQHEPQLVANLLFHIISRLRTNPFISASGIFVHGQPHIACDTYPKATPASVEIGDILLIRSDVASNGQHTNSRALLLQAKKAASIPTTPDNENQYYIYKKWPKFRYVRHMDIFNGQVRHASDVDMCDGAQYLILIKGNGCPACYFYPYGGGHPHSLATRAIAHTAHASVGGLSHYLQFCSALVGFILGNYGKAYDPVPPASDIGWSRIIHDLTSVTATNASRYIQRAGATKAPQRGMFHLFGAPRANSPLASAFGATPGFGKNTEEPPLIPLEPERNQTEDDQPKGITILEFSVLQESDSAPDREHE